MRTTMLALLSGVLSLVAPLAVLHYFGADLPFPPETLWLVALIAPVAGGLRWRLPGALVPAVLGPGLIWLVHGWVGPAVWVAPARLSLPVLAGAYAIAAALCGSIAAWVAIRRRRRGGGTLIDPLTGLPNRRHGELFLEHVFAVAELGRPLAVLLVDVDRFTSYTDTYGESAAAGVLRSVANLLRQNTRNANLSVYWHRDRFACVLNGSNEEGAFTFACRLQDQARATGAALAVPTISIGVACYQSEMREAGDLIRAAESALKQAKRDGGDRVRLHGRVADELERARPNGGSTAGAGNASDSPAQRNVVVSARTAFVYSPKTSLRRRATEQLEKRRIRVIEGERVVDALRLLNRDFDVIVLDLTVDDADVHDLAREIRRGAPTTRIVGMPGHDGASIRTSVLAVPVDGHLLHTEDGWTFRPPLEELFGERDRLRQTALRAMELTDEVRAKEREAKRVREQTEAELRTVVQSIREVLFRMDRSGAWTSLSPAWTSITGQPIESSLGRPWLEFFHAEDRADLASDMEALLASGRALLQREARVRTRSGGLRWVEVRAQLTHDRNGHVLSASGTLTDITERRRAEEALHRSEEYFRALIENAVDLTVVLDGEGRIRYVSPAAERILGERVAQAADGGSLDALVHPDDLPAARAALRSIDLPGASVALELRARHADGSWRQLAISLRNLSHIPAVRGFVVNAHDVTEHHEAERALRESEEALYRARKMDAIGLLAGGVAHDFNNLLTSIHGHADLAVGALPPDHPVRADLVRIQEAATKANSLTRQLLAFGRRQVMRPKVLELNVFLSDMHKMLVRLVGETVQLHTELAATPDLVHADPMQLERAILNLAMNAREAMPRGGVLSIRTRSEWLDAEQARLHDMEPGAYVALSVSDTGHGIPSTILPHVFEPFFSTKPQTPGVGLGLSTVYGIARQIGGHVRVESRHGEENGPTGTTFTIWVPQARDAVEAAGSARNGGSGAETIALVEDEPAVRELASRILRGRGYNVITAEDGRVALDLLGRFPERIDMLVTDVVMPGMSGRDLADRLGTMRPGLRILFMSGYSPEAVESHGVLARGATFLEKPFSPDALLRRVRDVLDSTGQPGLAQA